MTHMTKLTLAILSVLALPTLGRAQNLLIKGSFGDPNNVVPLSTIVNPMTSGEWGVEEAVRDTGPTNGVNPHSNPWIVP